VKTTASLRTPELLTLAADAIMRRPENRGRFLACIQLAYDRAANEVSAHAVLFETEAAARAYANGNAEAEDKASPKPEGVPT